MRFWKQKAPPAIHYDPETEQPAIRQSICTGEMVGGFEDRKTGKFREIMLLRDQGEKAAFAARTGVQPEKIKIIY